MRRLLRTVPLTWWLVSLGFGALAASTTAGALHTAADARERWGRQAAVAVVLRPVAAGHTLASADVALRARPAGSLPVGAMGGLPMGRVALVDLFPGEVVVEHRLAGAGRDGPAALLAEGERGIAITALTGERPPLRVGDRVDLLSVPADGTAARPLARRRLVIAIEGETGAVTVAVEADLAAAVAHALERGRIVLALAP